jgi:hypothetical protein
MLDLRIVIAASVASIAILVLGLGLLLTVRTAREPGDGLVMSARIPEVPHATPVGSFSPPAPAIVSVVTPATSGLNIERVVAPKPAADPAAVSLEQVVAPADARTPEPAVAAAPLSDPKAIGMQAMPEPRQMPTPAAPPPAEPAAPIAREVVTTSAIPEQATDAAAPAPAAQPPAVAPDEQEKPARSNVRRRAREQPTPIRPFPNDPFSALLGLFQQQPARPR